MLVKLLLDAIVRWIHAHPQSAFSRHMLKDRGPRTDTRRMTRLDRLKSGLAYLSWAVLLAGVWLLISYLVFGKGLFSPDSPMFMVVFMGVFFAAAICLVAGLYLLLRVLV